MKVNKGARMDLSSSPVPSGQLNTFLRWPCHCPHTRSTHRGQTAVSECRSPDRPEQRQTLRFALQLTTSSLFLGRSTPLLNVILPSLVWQEAAV